MILLTYHHSSISNHAHHVMMEVISGSSEAQAGAIQSIRNLRRAFGNEQVEIEMVCHGSGISLLSNKSLQRSGVFALQASGVTFCACNNSLRMRHLSAKDLLKGVRVVPAGIAEVVRKEEIGWSYLKL